MASDSQYNEQNFAEDQQYNDYNEQNYSEAMDQGGQSGEAMNGGTDSSLPPKSSTDEDSGVCGRHIGFSLISGSLSSFLTLLANVHIFVQAVLKVFSFSHEQDVPIKHQWKLFIGGISWDTDQKDLKEYFSKFGEVSDITIKTDPATGKSRGFCFVTFATEETVDNVLKNVPHTIKGKTIDPKRAKARPGIKKIFVGGLDNDFPEADIKTYFEKYGKVENVELPFDKVKNQRRAFCFVTFETEDACEASCKQSKQKIGNKECDVKKATNKPDPRMGGRGGSWGAGFGGRGGGRGRGARGRGGPGFSQPQGWNAPGGYSGGYGGQGYGYNQGYGGGGGYGNYGNYDGYGGGYGGGYNGGYGNYDYSGYYNQGGGAGGYGQTPSNYGKTPRRGAATGASTGAYHPYSR